MMKLALTGSIGMGKSTVARMFERHGIPLFDADAEVRRMQATDAPLIAAIGAAFPGAVKDGRLDREALAMLVLADRSRLAELEALIHPAVARARAEFVETHAAAPVLLFDIPLLFETGGAAEFDKVIVVTAPEQVQRARVLARPGMTAKRLEAILARQLPDADKRARADIIIDTGGELAATEAQVAAIMACLGLKTGG